MARLEELRRNAKGRAVFDAFGSRYTDMFDDWKAVTEKQANVIGPIIEKISGRQRGLRILDPTCGPGTQAFGLARRGHHVVGTDISPKMIEIAIRQKARWGSSARFAVANMLNLGRHPTVTYDAAVCLGNSITAFNNDAEMVGALRQVRLKLRKGAPFVVGIRNYDAEKQKTLDGPFHFLRRPRPRSIHQTWEWLVDKPDQYYCSVYIEYYRATSFVWRFTAVWRSVTPAQLSQALGLAGFERIISTPTSDIHSEESFYRSGLDEVTLIAIAP